jgi:ubiquinone biosynthesis monooxygenase Coq7
MIPDMDADRLIVAFDRALRTLAGTASSARTYPGERAPEQPLSDDDRRHAEGLMRVNHTGEVCAQALYDGQALFARDAALRERLETAAREETDHLAWTSQRLRELDGRRSFANPVWYAGSFAIGACAGLVGDRVSLGFVVETERQVEEHLTGHLDRLPPQDARSRVVVDAMREDEIRHGMAARDAGALELPAPVRLLMRASARLMTVSAYRF